MEITSVNSASTSSASQRHRKIREAMSVLLDQYRVPLWHVGAGDAPAYRMLPGQGYRGYFELVALRAEFLTRDPRTHKEPAAPAHVLVCREDVAAMQRYFPETTSRKAIRSPNKTLAEPEASSRAPPARGASMAP